MAILNEPLCSTRNEGNTGIASCVFSPKNIVGAILVPPNFSYDAAKLADLKASLQADALLPNKANRIYVLNRFKAITDNSSEVTISESGYGDKDTAREGKYDWTFELADKGGLCLQRNLRKFNELDKKVLFFDSDNQIIGTSDSEGNFIGISLDFFYASPYKLADGTNPTQYFVRFALKKTSELNDTPAYVVAGFDIENEIKSIIDLSLTEVAVEAGKATVSVKEYCSKNNIYLAYSDELADPTAWIVKDDAGVIVVVSGVVAVPATESFELSFTGTGDYTINLVDPTALEVLGVGGAPDNGFESVAAISVTMPA